MRRLFVILLAASLTLGLASRVAAEPLNLLDPTPRAILVEVDENTDDYAAIGSMYGEPFEGAYSSDGIIGTVTIDGSLIEDRIDAIFAGTATAVPGSFTDYVIRIDLATLEVISAEVSGSATVPFFGTVSLTQTASSTETAGFNLTSFFGTLIPIFCTSGPDCTIVPGLPFDPLTGAVNAVGKIDSILDAFAPFGDLRFSEAPAPFCDVEMSQPVYVAGEQVVITMLRFVNPTPAPVPTRLRFQIQIPIPATFDVFDLGAGGGFAFPPGVDANLAPVPLFTVQGQPQGSWAIRCAFEDPVSGAIMAEDIAPFDID